MAFKINISNKDGKTYKLELESEELIGKKIHDKIDGKDLLADLEGYEFEIMGASDKAGFPSLEHVEGISLKKVLLSYETGMNRRPKYEGKKKRSENRPKGLRLRKTVRGNTISADTIQINLKAVKDGGKKLSEIFPDQAKGKERENRKTKRAKVQAEKSAEANTLKGTSASEDDKVINQENKEEVEQISQENEEIINKETLNKPKVGKAKEAISKQE